MLNRSSCLPVSLRRKPANLTFEEASAIGVNFIAAWCGVMEAARVQAGETIVIIGVGGVGGAAAQIAKRIGAKVVGVARGAAATSPYVDVMVDSQARRCHRKRWRIREAANGGAAVVFDTVGGSMFETAVHMLKVGGRLVEISATDRREVTFNLADFYHNESRLIGVDTLKRDSGRIRENAWKHCVPASKTAATKHRRSPKPSHWRTRKRRTGRWRRARTAAWC